MVGGQVWGSGRGAIAGCHCSVLWLGGEGDDTRVPLQGAEDVVPLLGAVVGCHCSVLWLGGRFGGVDVVPLQGAIVVCYGLGHLSLH